MHSILNVSSAVKGDLTKQLNTGHLLNSVTLIFNEDQLNDSC